METGARLLLDLYRAARELPVPEFEEHAVMLLRRAVRFDSGMWGTGEVDAVRGLAMHSIYLHNQPMEMLASYEEIKDHDLAAYEAHRHLGKVCNINFREINAVSGYSGPAAHAKKYDTQNLLVTAVHDKSLSSLSFVSLWRAKESDRYSEEERCRSACFLPHLFEAGAINRLLWLNALTITEIPKGGARAIADLHGTIHACDQAFPAVLREEWPAWDAPLLPPPLRSRIQTVSAECRFVGVRISVAAKYQGGMLFLRAEERPADGLTPAQRDVARLIADGRSYKEAARELSISPATVRNHLHVVYAKLGVRDKVGLARRMEGAG